MARITEDRISHLANLAVDTLRKAAKLRNERLALIEAKRVLAFELDLESRLDETVRRRMPRHVPVGSRDWDILFRKYMEEEIRKAKPPS